MQYRTLCGNQVSSLGFGMMRLPVVDGDNGKIDKEKTFKMLETAVEAGVNYLDTAWPYHNKTSELVTGEFLKGHRETPLYVADKLPLWLVKGKDDFDRFLDEQLTKLQRDSIDYYLFHAINRDRWQLMQDFDLLSCAEKAKQEGRIKHIGFSFHDTIDIFRTVADAYPWEFCQIQYNFMDIKNQAGAEGLYYAKEKGIDVIVMEPLRGGSFTKKVPTNIAALWNAGNEKWSAAEWALRWVFNHPEVSLTLSGMTTLEQVIENCRIAGEAGPDSLTDFEKETVEKVRDAYKDAIKVNCTNCRYCMPCPQGVNIPGNFLIYNDIYLYQDEELVRRSYGFWEDKKKAANCVACGICESHCPQNIPIIKQLNEVKEFFEK